MREQFRLDAQALLKQFMNLLDVGLGDRRSLEEAVDVLGAFERAALDSSAQSCAEVALQGQKLLGTCLANQQLPGPLECEVLKLAGDWLSQLIVLFAEELPEPRSLVVELLDTFALVERYQGAESTLADLIAAHEGKDLRASEDLFAEDPEMAMMLSPQAAGDDDPFSEDPGFSLEFDLLQRTLRRVPEMPAADADLFAQDPEAQPGDEPNQVSTKPASKERPLPFDPFAGDPSPG